MTKGQAHRLRKSIYEHQKRTSHLYAELAEAPTSIQQSFLGTFSNPLTRRYAAARIADAVMDAALSRIGSLDPYPYEHVHDGCIMNQARSDEAGESEYNVFKPRLGYITDQGAYPS